MKRILVAVIALMLVLSANAQLLYKISGNGLKKSSYIIGTYHLADVKFAKQVPGLDEALNASEQVVGELDMAFMQDPAKLKEMQNAMMLPEGQTIKDLLTAEQFQRLDSVTGLILGMKLSNPLVWGQLSKMSPTALEQQFSVLLALKITPGQFDPTRPFDGYFQDVAKSKGKEVKGFETFEFQMNTLLKGTPMKRQVERLICLVDNLEYNKDLTKQLIDIYHKQDLDAMSELLDMKLNNSCDATPEEEDALIYNRNADWLTKMPTMMKEKPTFFAVGAAHLIGDKGVLHLLKEKGYKIEAVK